MDASTNITNDSRARNPARRAVPLVLVAEDHDDTGFMLQYVLEMRGCTVAIARDGETAVREAENACPDLILMDTGLPILDGLAATRRIRELAMLRNVPIIFISGHAQPAFRAEALETGGTDFLVKPFEIARLEKILERHLGKGATVKAD